MIHPQHAALLRDPSVKKWLIVGQVGDGKSALINALCGREVARTAMDPAGVTKKVGYFLSACKQRLYIDTPGIGDLDVSLAEFVTLLEASLETLDVHGVIVCSKTYTRIQLGGQLIVRIVDAAFKSAGKWDSVIFNFTHADRASEEERKNLPRVIDVFCDKVLQTKSRPRVCTTQCAPGGGADITGLATLMAQMSQGIGAYTKPSDQGMAEIISKVTSQKYDDVLKIVQGLREEMELQRKEYLRQLTDMQRTAMQQSRRLYEEQRSVAQQQARAQRDAELQLTALRQQISDPSDTAARTAAQQQTQRLQLEIERMKLEHEQELTRIRSEQEKLIRENLSQKDKEELRKDKGDRKERYARRGWEAFTKVLSLSTMAFLIPGGLPDGLL